MSQISELTSTVERVIVLLASDVILDAITFVKFAPSPRNEVAFTVPLTSNGYTGFVVPIPTLPVL
jgi:hypothetical protein